MTTERTPFPINIYAENERELYEAFTSLGVPMLTESQILTASVLLARRSELKATVDTLSEGPTSLVEITWDKNPLMVTRPQFIAFLQDQIEGINHSLGLLGVAIEDPL